MARVKPSSNTPAFANGLYNLRCLIIPFVAFYDRARVLEPHATGNVWVKSI